MQYRSLPERRLKTSGRVPLSAVLKTGLTVTWTYRSPESLNPPAAPQVSTPEQETYKTIDPSGYVAAFDTNLPSVVGDGYRLVKAFEYDATTGDGPAYYAIWSDSQGGDIQLIVNVGSTLDSSQLGYSADSGLSAFRAQEGSNIIQILCPDDATLRASVELLRPADSPLLPTSMK